MAVIEKFLSCKDQYKQSSWRAVIWSLHKANEIQLAEHIRRLNFTEPVEGSYNNTAYMLNYEY